MAYMIRNGRPDAGVVPIDWARFARYNPAAAASSRFSALLGGAGVADREPDTSHERVRLPDEEGARLPLLVERLSKTVASLLGVASDAMSRDVPLESLGFDSLMAVELSMRIQQDVSVELPRMALLSKGLSVDGLARIVSEEYGRGRPTRAAATARQPGKEPDPEAIVDELSADELAALLEEVLEMEEQSWTERG
jgi:acyl carrier protein